jgi:hypothetical protein
VALGRSGSILTSSDGIAWTDRTTESVNATLVGPYHLKEVTYGNGTFVIVGESGTILTSTDGTTWVSRNSDQSFTEQGLSGVAYGNSTFVAVGGAGNVLTSSDGITWTPRTSGTNGTLSEVIYKNNIFIAVSGRTVFTSPDGITWTNQTSFSSNSLYSLSNTTLCLRWVIS